MYTSTSTNIMPSPTTSPPTSAEQQEVSQSPFDSFDFDDELPGIIDYDRHGHASSAIISVSNSSNSSISSDVQQQQQTLVSSPFMLGDYTEKEHFLPSTSILRNEVLELYLCKEIDTDVLNGKRQQRFAFRCIHCKNATDRADMAEIHPKSLMEIRETFLSFEQTHVPTCTFIPTSIREGYDKYKSDETKYYDDVSDEFVWVSSAIHRGLRDSQFGEKGIVYLPELASPYNLSHTIPKILEYISHEQANSNVKIVQPKYNIQTRDLLETDILFQPGHSGLELIGHGGNHYWHRIMIDLRPTYVCGLSAKTLIIRLIVKISRQRNPPGRFLLQDQVSGLWNEIGDEEAEALTYAMMEHEGRHSYSSSSGATLAVTGTGHQADTFDKAFEIAKALKALEKEDAGGASLLNHHLDPNVYPSTSARPNSVVEEENEATCQPKKKQKLENRASVVDTLKQAPEPSRRLSSRQPVVSLESTNMLSILFYNTHGSEQELELEKKTKPHGSSSRYNGVYIRNVKSCSSFEASFLAFRLGNQYILQSDAALAYDSAIRARGLKEHYRKINFDTQEDYLQAREEEMKNRGISICLEETLVGLISTVKAFKDQLVSKQVVPESSRVSPRRKTGVSSKLSSLFYCHDDEKVGLKNIKSSGLFSAYNGLKKSSTIVKGRRVTIFHSEILDIHLASFILESDAALAYDAAVRAQELEDHYEKINFATEKLYTDARTKELKNRDIPHVDLEGTLDLIVPAVRAFQEQLASKQDEPESSPRGDTTSSNRRTSPRRETGDATQTKVEDSKADEEERDVEESELLDELFYNIHGSEGELELKKTEVRGSTSSYKGVYRVPSKRFETRFIHIRLGSYLLQTDAALAYDSAIRARGLEEHYNKINFDTKEDYLEAREKELENRDIIVDLEETLSHMSSYVSKVVEVAESELLSSLFHNYHGSEKGLVLTKNIKSLKATSQYNGVYTKKAKAKSNHESLFQAQFGNKRLGSYPLETDAALAYDAAIRARRSKKYYTKINFATEKSYLKAREKELKAQEATVDLRGTLVYITDMTSVVEEEAEELDVPEEEDGEVEEDEVTSLLSDLFRGNGNDVRQKKTSKKKKKIKSSKSLSCYKGVHVQSLESKASAQFLDYRLGRFTLQSDAALAYDSAIRARGLEKHYEKINFDTKKDYLQAREEEMEERSVEVDLEDILSNITDMVAKVFKA